MRDPLLIVLVGLGLVGGILALRATGPGQSINPAAGMTQDQGLRRRAVTDELGDGQQVNGTGGDVRIQGIFERGALVP